MPSTDRYRYRPDVLAQLAGLGVFPKPHTRPDVVLAFVRDLYRVELRRLRDRLVRKEIPKTGYAYRVVALRRRYPLVSLKAGEFLERPGPGMGASEVAADPASTGRLP